MTRRGRETDPPLRILVADDSPDAIAQMTAWIRERWPTAEVFGATTPDEAIRIATEERIENLVLDLDFGAQRDSGAAREQLRHLGDQEHADQGTDAAAVQRRVHQRIQPSAVHASEHDADEFGIWATDGIV